MKQRVISAIVALPLLFIVTIIGGVVFRAAVTAITAIALFEYIKAYKNSEYKAQSVVLLLGFIAMFGFLFAKGDEVYSPFIFLVAVVAMALPIFSRKYNVLSSAVTLVGFVYIVCFFSLLTLIREHDNGNYLIWIVFIIAWCTDTFAYFFGRAFGKHKLSPEVSPKKTVEGSIGGILACMFALLVYSIAVGSGHIAFHVVQLLVLGFFGSVVAQIGDLSASLIKRHTGIKDYGKIMPGHGGILDRFDSILFTAPVVYYCILIFIG